MPILKFQEGDRVRVANESHSASAHAGEEGEIVSYLGPMAIKLTGQDKEQAQLDPWYNVRLDYTNTTISVLESELTPLG